MSKPVDVLVFPLDCNIHDAMAAKQHNACERSIKMLTDDLESTEYGAGYKRMIQQRIDSARATMKAIEKKYSSEV